MAKQESGSAAAVASETSSDTNGSKAKRKRMTPEEITAFAMKHAEAVKAKLTYEDFAKQLNIPVDKLQAKISQIRNKGINLPGLQRANKRFDPSELNAKLKDVLGDLYVVRQSA